MENFKVKDLLVNIYPHAGSATINQGKHFFNEVAEGSTKCIQPSRSILSVDGKCMQPSRTIMARAAESTTGVTTLSELKQAVAALQQNRTQAAVTTAIS